MANFEGTPLVEGRFTLQKFEGKGGWTYIELPKIDSNQKRPFGWISVSGVIDEISFSRVKLMGMGNGNLMFSVNAKLRKRLRKEAGDAVDLKLIEDSYEQCVPEEIILCLKEEPSWVLDNFNGLPPNEKRKAVEKVLDAKNEEEKVDRIVSLIDKLSK
ncbi:YdeI/OmpD-associated family protein [Aureibacter tunicatorum]|uniref:DUF1905 domain-containing protein n=1 Tax=Aureibacter tunicatorum TaxID=866807 RepID=A0AAE3XTA7_9BACT|nr:YdeI/OmpD-associated family protein [Aureibacter tunicatorum]MDR6241471.1 hypothetical protein [Aureibacter tunicatorum]BDD06686.1 hypothetical protein AUTU_41690 [Aureibacter tunicatorum]